MATAANFGTATIGKTANMILKVAKNFWIPKIKRNILRDREVSEKLTADGWTVLRFFGKEIKKNLADCVQKISETVA